MKNRIISLVEDAHLKKEVPVFTIGDQVDVHQRILEGEKERIQIFSGVVISMRGEGMREMFSVRRIVQGEGVERTFPIHSPKVAKVEVKRTGIVRRAKLYYLRDRVGKSTRLRERKPKVVVPATRGRAPRPPPAPTPPVWARRPLPEQMRRLIDRFRELRETINRHSGGRDGSFSDQTLVAALVRHAFRTLRRAFPQEARLPHPRPQLFLSARRNRHHRP